MLDEFEQKLDDLKTSTQITASYDDDLGYWEKVRTKQVHDADGFMTEYALWYNSATNEYVTIFGDTDLYNPSNSFPDMEFGDNEDEAIEWFDSYTGFDDLDDDTF